VTIRFCALPEEAFLRRYDHGGGCTDCFVVVASGLISLSQYVEAFYTTGLFKVERAMLSLAGRPSSDGQANQVAEGVGSTFAAWQVEDRAEDQLLMCDVTGRTRSWFMAAPVPDEASDRTLLYFGSAITAARKGTAGRMTIGPVFKALTGFHILYSRALLAAAEKRIERLNDQVKP
jgi:hypothetical protein